MKRAYLATVLDLSLPPEDARGLADLARGISSWMQLLEALPAQRLEVAIAGAVTEALLRQGHQQAVQMLAERASFGQVSFLATAAYGAFLPLVPGPEAQRQLERSEAINRETFGEWIYTTTGLFPPQLGYSRSIAELAMSRGLQSILLDDLAYRGGGSRRLPRDRHFALREHVGFRVFFVDRLLSQQVGDGLVTTPGALHKRIGDGGYALIRIPARLLSAEGPGLRLIATLDDWTPVVPASLEELNAHYPEFEVVDPLACALGTEHSEIAAGVQFAKWSAPDNELHALLWRLVQLASDEAQRVEGRQATTRPGQMRNLLDESLDCAAWRFASGRPEFEPGKVAEGGARIMAAIRAGGDMVRPDIRAESEQLFARLQERCLELARRVARLEAAIDS